MTHTNKIRTFLLLLLCLCLLPACSLVGKSNTSSADVSVQPLLTWENGTCFLTIKYDNICQVLYDTGKNSGGFKNTDGSPFKPGEKIELAYVKSMNGMSLALLDAKGDVVVSYYQVEEGQIGHLQVDLSKNSGQLDLKLYPIDDPDHPAYTGKNLESGSFTVNLKEPGLYQADLTCQDFDGHYTLNWDVEDNSSNSSATCAD